MTKKYITDAEYFFCIFLLLSFFFHDRISRGMIEKRQKNKVIPEKNGKDFLSHSTALCTSCKTKNAEQKFLINFISHEIKSYLSKSRNAFSMLLEGDYGEISPEVRAVAVEGLSSGTKAVSLIENILNAANIERGSIRYAMEPIELSSLIKKKHKGYQTITEAKRLKFLLEIAEGDYRTKGDAGQLRHALKNLIENAIRYTEKGSITFSLKRTGDKISFSLKDTGVGISPEDMKFLFTAGGKGTQSHIFGESTGYGLYIVKNVIEAHGGKIWAESEGEGKGSQFHVELPVK